MDHLLALGWGKAVRQYDYFGFGLGIGRSIYKNGLWQGVIETYYQWQATKELTISPDLQIITGKGTENQEDLHVVAGLRAGITF